jgi:hypothetical protein
MSKYINYKFKNFDHLSTIITWEDRTVEQYAYVQEGISPWVLDLGLNLVWLGTIWGTAVGILIGDVMYFLTDSLLAFLIVIPFALAGYYLGKRGLRKYGSLGDMKRERM